MGSLVSKFFIPLIVTILVIGFLLYTNSTNHKKKLDGQAVKNIALIKTSFLSAYEDFFLEYNDYIEIKKNNKNESLLSAFDTKGYPDNRENFNKNDNLKLRLLSGKHHINQTIAGKDSLIFIIELQRFFRYNVAHQFFDQVLLVDSSGIIHYPNNYLGANLLNQNNIEKQDKENLKAGVSKYTIEFDNEKSYLYYTPIHYDGMDAYIVGVISEEHFAAVGLRLDFFLVNSLIILLLLLIFSLPIITFLSMESDDVLTKKRVFSLGLSLIFIMLILGFTFSYLFQYNSVDKRNYNYINNPSHEGSDTTDYKKAYLYIQSKLASAIDIKTENSLPNFINERITVDKTNKTIALEFIKNDSLHNLNFNELSLTERPYITYFDSVETSSKIFIDGHYSRNTGKMESVVSKKNDKDIVAVTFEFRPHQNEAFAKLNKDRRILLLKSDGKVIYKTDKVTIPLDSIQQAIPNDTWNQLEGLMKNNNHADSVDFKIPLHLDGLEYTAILKLMDAITFDKPVWMVYLHNDHLFDHRAGLISTEAVILIGIYSIILLLISAISRLDRHDLNDHFHRFTYYFLEPRKNRKIEYAFLIVTFGIYILVLLSLPFLFTQNVLSLLMDLTLMLLLVAWLIRITLQDSSWHKLLHYHGKFLAMTLITLVVIGILSWSTRLLDTLIILKILYLFIPAIFHCLLLHYKMDIQRRLLRIVSEENISFKKIYPLFIAFWIIIIGFLPAFLIYKQVAKYETKLWIENHSPAIPNQNSTSDVLTDYYEFRRLVFGSIRSSQDSELQNFITPNIYRYSNAFLGEKSNSKIDWSIALLINTGLAILIVLIFINLIHHISKKLFWLEIDLPLQKIDNILKNDKKVFLVCVDQALVPIWIKDNDFENPEYFMVSDAKNLPTSYKTNPDIIVLKNIHLHPEQKEIPKVIYNLIKISEEKNCPVLVTSAKQWRDLFLTLDDDQSKMNYSEIFSEFRFKYLPLDHTYNILLISKPPLTSIKNYIYRSYDKFLKDLKSHKHTLSVFKKRYNTILLDFVIPPHLQIKYFSQNLIQSFFNNFEAIKLHQKEKDIISQSNIIDSIQYELKSNKPQSYLMQSLIQKYSKSYYANIWTELNIEEKKVCYYLSKHGFINFANIDTVTNLFLKGILYKDPIVGKIRFFSKTFRSFILIFISADRVQQFKLDERKNGSVRILQIGISSFVIIAISLISFFDKGFLDEFSAIITGSVGLAGTLFALLSKVFPAMKTPN